MTMTMTMTAVTQYLPCLCSACCSAEKREEAWQHLQRAHSEMLRLRDPQAASLALIEERGQQILQIFSKDFFPRGVGSKSKTPVFIVGMMR